MDDTQSTYHTGQVGEEIASKYLEGQGYRILDVNYRYERAEVDLVCFDPAQQYEEGGELVVVEVKARRGLSFGRPEEAVSYAKQQQIIKATRAYLHERQLEGAPVRFDVIAIVLKDDDRHNVEHFKHAFTA